MTNLPVSFSPKTMTSREVADLAHKAHKNVIRDIRAMLTQLYGEDGSDLDYKEIQGVTLEKDERGYTSMVTLDKNHTLCLVSGYDSRARMEVAKRVKENDTESLFQAMRDFEVPDDLPDMFVYAIREVDTGNVKLGISRDPARRLRQLQIGNSSRLQLVATHRAERRFADEGALHADASEYQIRGEWFEPTALTFMH